MELRNVFRGSSSIQTCSLWGESQQTINHKVNMSTIAALSFVPCGTMGDTEVKETQVSWRAGEAIFGRCSGAGGTGVITRQTEAQLRAVRLLLYVVCTSRTLAHTAAVWKITRRQNISILIY